MFSCCQRVHLLGSNADCLVDGQFVPGMKGLRFVVGTQQIVRIIAVLKQIFQVGVMKFVKVFSGQKLVAVAFLGGHQRAIHFVTENL